MVVWSATRGWRTFARGDGVDAHGGDHEEIERGRSHDGRWAQLAWGRGSGRGSGVGVAMFNGAEFPRVEVVQ